MHEKNMVSPGADDANFNAILWIPASEAIKDVDIVAGIEVVDSSFTVNFKGI